MSHKVKAFATFTCDRCNCKESVSVKPLENHWYKMEFKAPTLPKDWKEVDRKEYCPGCAYLIKLAMGATA